MSGQRQKNRPEQGLLAFPAESRSDAPKAVAKGTETHMAKHRTESLAGTEQLMEEVCERENCKQALQRVKANKGSPGVDGMTVDELPEYLKQHGLEIGEQLRNGTYQPQPVRRVEIPKPDGQGVRKLGIPCVLDRFIQQAVLQVLQKRWDPTFSEHSHGFRPGRSAKQAVHEAQQYIAEGYRWVVDLDLEKFFDRVNHDRLLAAVAERVADKRMLKLIRAFLKAGVMEDGLVSAVDEGTPQGGPITPRTQTITGWLGGGRTRNVGARRRIGTAITMRNRNRMSDDQSIGTDEDLFNQQAQDLLAFLDIQRLSTCTQFFSKSTQALGKL